MDSKLVRITLESESIAKKHGKTVSDGIIRMNELIRSGPAPVVFNEEYWTRLSSICKQTVNITPVNLGIPKVNVKPASMFKPANTVPRDIIRDGWGDEPRDETGQILDE